MDKGVVELVGIMNDVLSFVEDTDILKEKLQTFLNTVGEALLTIDECNMVIQKYLSNSTAGTKSND